MRVAFSGYGHNEHLHHWYPTWESCSYSSNGHFHVLMWVKMVWKSWSVNSGNLHS